METGPYRLCKINLIFPTFLFMAHVKDFGSLLSSFVQGNFTNT